MKKSFKRSIAVLLSVIMAATTMPFSALAAAGEYNPDIQLQFGTFWNASAGSPLNQENQYDYDYSLSGIYGPVVDLKNGALTLDATKYAAWNDSFGMEDIDESYTLTEGDIFTLTVRLDNVNKISAFEAAISYSNNIAPLVDPDDWMVDGSIPFLDDSIYEDLNDSALGNLSYVDTENNVIVASAAANNVDYADVSSTAVTGLTNPATGEKDYDFANKAVIATFVFQVVDAGPITFGIYNGDEDSDNTYGGAFYIADVNDGTDPADYTTYEPADAIGSTDMTFMSKNEYNAPSGYTITFIDATGAEISSAEYAEGADVTIPALPAAKTDAQKHYTYAWDVEPSATATADATYTIVETAAAHSYTESIEKDATCQDKGVKKYTCDCGYSYTEDIATTSHAYGPWVFNGDAQKSVDGTQTRTCATCGDTETTTAVDSNLLKANTLNLALSDGIAINFNINTTSVNKFDRVWCVVNKWNYKFNRYEEFVIEDSTVSGTRKQYQFVNMAPQNMADALQVVFHGEKNGVEYWGYTYETTARTYIMSQLNKQTTANSTAVLYADILNYGEAAQTYTGYNTSDPMTSEMTAAQKNWISPVPTEFNDIQNSSYATVASPKAKWRTAALSIDSTVSFKLSFSDPNNGTTLTDLSKIKVKVTRIDDNSVFWFTQAENPDAFTPYGTTGRWNFLYKLPASNMSYGFAFTLCDENGNEISNTFSYSADSFASRQKGKSIQPLSDALVAYARSAYNYVLKGGK